MMAGPQHPGGPLVGHPVPDVGYRVPLVRGAVPLVGKTFALLQQSTALTQLTRHALPSFGPWRPTRRANDKDQRPVFATRSAGAGVRPDRSPAAGLD
jgi:hypothetical protein